MNTNDTSYALLTDLYQLTMGQAYYFSNTAQTKACFYGYFRKNPFNGGYTISCGKDQLLNVINNFKFTNSDIEYLKTLKSPSNTPLFKSEYLKYLQNTHLQVDIDMIDDGCIVFPHQPTFRVIGPLLQCQLLETPLLNALGFQSLIATKTARIVHAANGAPISEFGLRRAQGPNGALSASRAAFVGGAKSVANVAAAKQYGIPTSGTHGHSWVMSFDSELKAFREYAKSNPDNCIFLVDTYNVFEGIKNAIIVAKELEKKSKRLHAIRIDSGDLAWLSKKARRMLDEAGLSYVGIILTNDLDEYTIEALNQQGACYTSLGVGTKLVCAYDQPSLGLVYKLAAIEKEGKWIPKIKLSEQKTKQSLPGVLNTKRFLDQDKYFIGDMVYDEKSMPNKPYIAVDPTDETRRILLDNSAQNIDLLHPVMKNGQIVNDDCDVHKAQNRCTEQLSHLDDSIKRHMNPHSYPAGIEKSLIERRNDIIYRMRGIQNLK